MLPKLGCVSVCTEHVGGKPCLRLRLMQVFLAILAREYDWDCNSDERWISAENFRYILAHSFCLDAV